MDTHWHRCSFPSSHQSWRPVLTKSVQLHYRSLSSPKHNNPYQAETRRTGRHQGTLPVQLFDTINRAMHRQTKWKQWSPARFPNILGRLCRITCLVKSCEIIDTDTCFGDHLGLCHAHLPGFFPTQQNDHGKPQEDEEYSRRCSWTCPQTWQQDMIKQQLNQRCTPPEV